ncbi:hypothetical protein AG1IA_01523 [Rhizoctonia solani AG-1 IA]|uniref:Uncharacterized protein n=1 Tax=Thanatephorus cucumeris (strain AG1-IA) TaxID=983506 RepID=L8X729_THACA|nr:hypothetical protein AG1IA_01523 [Rhizoctonia solani AG-1 IA]
MPAMAVFRTSPLPISPSPRCNEQWHERCTGTTIAIQALSPTPNKIARNRLIGALRTSAK